MGLEAFFETAFTTSNSQSGLACEASAILSSARPSCCISSSGDKGLIA